MKKIKKFNESSSYKYEVVVTYDTGDSFSNEYGVEGSLTLEWNDKKIAKEAVDRVEDHYKFYQELNGYSGRVHKSGYGDERWKSFTEVNKEYSTRDWAIVEWKFISISRNQVVSKEYQEKHSEDCEKIPFVSELSLKIKGDNGEIVTQSAFWCGHFESLSYVEVRYKGGNYRKSF